jgi:prepilin signal peptidase PulO-like enzyme (type II secretory pathway)
VARMFRVLAFFCLVIALMGLWGGLTAMATLFFAQTGMFLALSFVDLSERTYMTIFMAYLLIAFTGFMFYAFFGDYPKNLDEEHASTIVNAVSSFL